MQHTRATAAILGLMMAGMAEAQIAPAPPPAPIPTPEWAPPPPPPPPPDKVVTPAVVLPDLPYTSLVKKDASERLVRLTLPAEWAALDQNPLIKDDKETQERIAGALAERRADFEKRVMDNLDLVQKLDEGLVEQLDLSDRKKMTEIMETTKPLVSRLPLGKDLRDRGLLSPEQEGFNKKIEREYTKALQEQNAKEFENNKPELAAQVFKLAINQGLAESMWARRRLLLEAAPNIDSLLGQLGLSAAERDRVAPIVARVKKATADDARFEAMRELTNALTVAQRRDVLTRTVAARPKR